ncbi:hypothetical protein DTO164E3_6619 [Paecilomyces variotii]|nr:hypothetical protein DTO164E3_6619 [Paecilomyces variotii]KAJ9409817.1 hypothetical protein DTO045G8_2293 [Paecilomyces variotii]
MIRRQEAARCAVGVGVGEPSVIRSAGHSRLHGRITSDAMPTKAVPMPFHACNFEAVSSNLPWDKQPKKNLCDGFPMA